MRDSTPPEPSSDPTPPNDPRESGGMTLTPVRDLVVAFLFGLLIGWGVVLVAGWIGTLPPQVPWSAPVALILAAILIGIFAYATHQRIQVNRRYIEPQQAVTLLLLGKASALVGMLVAGGYLSFALMFVSTLEASNPRDRVIRSGVAVIGGIAMTVGGIFLERACKVPDDEDEDPDPT